jgi:hypothetical protein
MEPTAMTERTDVAVSEPSRVVPHRTMKHLVLDIQKKFQRTIEVHQKFRAERIRLGQDLLEARARVEAGEEGNIGWWEWYQQKFTRSREDAEKVMAIARAENPEAAYVAAKEKNAAINRDYRERQKQFPPLT